MTSPTIGHIKIRIRKDELLEGINGQYLTVSLVNFSMRKNSMMNIMIPGIVIGNRVLREGEEQGYSIHIKES